jgi:glc operon protein GlcG
MGLNHETVLKHLADASAAASQQNLKVAVVVVDTGGRVVGSVRMDGVGFLNHDAALRKAVASANFGAPTAMLGKMMGGDPMLAPVMNDPAMLLLPGGAPLRVDGVLVGGIGIAGGHYNQDQAVLDATLSA